MSKKSLWVTDSPRRQFIYVVTGALVLFVIGAASAYYDIVPLISGPASEQSQTQRNAAIGNQARRQMTEQRATWSDDLGARPPQTPTDSDGYYQPPSDAQIPDDELGASIRRGREIFLNTGTNAGEYVGNELTCSSCHLNAGRRPDSAAMWAAAVRYPKYRGKNDMVNTLEDRINGCFTFSMNGYGSPSGGPPPTGDQIYKDLQAYFFWLADGLPVGGEPPGTGFPSLDETDDGYDWQRGEQVFMDNCAVCHGADGQGRKDINGRYIFPPLWGPNSFNWGAGMHRVNTAASFIKANMPLGKPYSLSDQEAWDAAAYITSFPRPPDPRQADGKMTVKQARETLHQGHMESYGETIHGIKLGAGATPERWQQFLDAQDSEEKTPN